MSKNSKNSNKAELARTFTLMHLEGKKGPARTKTLHLKDRAKRWCHNRLDWYLRNTKDRKSQFKGQ